MGRKLFGLVSPRGDTKPNKDDITWMGGGGGLVVNGWQGYLYFKAKHVLMYLYFLGQLTSNIFD